MRPAPPQSRDWFTRAESASALSTLTGLSLHMALYRLYYADWYVAMLVLGPGLLYEALACAVAVPFAESLRGIQR